MEELKCIYCGREEGKHACDSLRCFAEGEIPNCVSERKLLNTNFKPQARVTRLEIIDHSKKEPKGRVYVNSDIKDFELSYQDDGRTLKIFIKQ